MNAPPPRRVAVTRSGAPGSGRGAPVFQVAVEIDDETALGEVYLWSLIRDQLRLGLRVCGLVCGGIALLPLLFAIVPAAGRADLLGIRIPWLLLGVLVYPGFVLAGWHYLRRAERNEREFTARVEQ